MGISSKGMMLIYTLWYDLAVCYWKWPFSLLIYLFYIVIFHSYVSLPKGNSLGYFGGLDQQKWMDILNISRVFASPWGNHPDVSLFEVICESDWGKRSGYKNWTWFLQQDSALVRWSNPIWCFFKSCYLYVPRKWTPFQYTQLVSIETVVLHSITVLLQVLLCPLFEVYGKLGKIIVLTK